MNKKILKDEDLSNEYEKKNNYNIFLNNLYNDLIFHFYNSNNIYLIILFIFMNNI